MSAREIVIVGRLGGPFGVQGWLHVHSYTSPPENLRRYQPWFFKSEQASDWREIAVTVRGHQKGFVALLEGVADRDRAQRLTGQSIGVPADVLPRTDPDEYYWRDLIGCRVLGGSDELGCVSDLMETGAHDVLVVETPDGGEMLIPFTAPFVVSVDLPARSVQVDWERDWS